MARGPGAKIVGKVAIKGVPDTSGFRTELKEKLKAIESSTSFRITVDRARLNRVQIRESLQEQLDAMSNLNVTVDAKLIISEEKKVQFQHDIRELVKWANRQDIKIPVQAATAGATAQLRWLSRDRFVDIVPRISQTAMARVGTQLAALSGLRVTWDWTDKILDWLENLDKSLPKLMLWTSGIANLVSGILGLGAGIVGLGQGLVQISPGLLLLPGLIANSAASLTVLIVALRNSSTELSALSGFMSELGEIINKGFWDKARQPIIDLVTNLMPQLRTAFANVSDGVGTFTSALANAFSKELSNGRLLSIFDNINKGWSILAEGADGFASAMVNLSEVAAKYTPRLAQWFVDIADRFDGWLSQVSTDGRLDIWMEGAIAGMKDLWKIVTNTAGVFKGMWDAAAAAGYEGLAGIAKTLESWNETVNSPKFQKGMTGLFKGAREGLQAMGDGLAVVGDAIAEKSGVLENFLIRAGEIFGTLLAGIGDIISSPAGSAGITKFIDGLKAGVDGFVQYLPGISEGIGGVLSFAGDLASKLGPVLGAALDTLSGFLQPVLDSIQTGIVDKLGPGLESVFSDPEIQAGMAEFGESLGKIVEAIGSAAEKKIPALKEALKGLLPFLTKISEIVAFLVSVDGKIQDLVNSLSKGWTGPGDLAQQWFPDLYNWFTGGDTSSTDSGASGMGGGQSVRPFTVPGIDTTQWNNSLAAMASGTSTTWAGITGNFTTGGSNVSGLTGTASADAAAKWASMRSSLTSSASGMWGSIQGSFSSGTSNAGSIMGGFRNSIAGFFSNPLGFLWSVGYDIMSGLINGLKERYPGLTSFIQTLISFIPNAIKKALGIASPSKVMRFEIGRWIPAGLELGIQDGLPSLNQTVEQMVSLPTVTPQSISSSFSETSQLVNAGTSITFMGDVGYDPDKIATAIARKKSLQNSLYGVGKVRVA